MRTRTELVEPAARPMGGRGTGEVLAYGLILSLGLALFVSPFASAWPDGLEKVAEMPAVGSAGAATALAGSAGTVVAFLLAWILGRVLLPARSTAGAPGVR